MSARISISVPVALLMVVLGGCKDFKKSYDTQFKASYAREFGASCTKGAVQQGAPEPKAKAMCECMAKNLVDNHSTTELTKLSMSATSAESQKLFADAANACKDSIK